MMSIALQAFDNVDDFRPGPARERASPSPSEHSGGGLPGVRALHAGRLSRRHISTQIHLQAGGQERQ